MFGWTTIAVRSEVKRRLREFMERRGIRSPNDAIAYLLDFYEENSRLDRVYEELERALARYMEFLQLAKHVYAEQEKRAREAVEKLVSLATASVSTQQGQPSESSS
jgi:hypothetical protein